MARDTAASRTLLLGLAGAAGLLVAVGLAATSGCPAKSPPVTEAPAGESSAGEGATEGAPAQAAEGGEVPEGACGPRALRMEDFGWLPADARVVIRFDLEDPRTPQALAHLAERARAEDHGLPITLAFGATQWPIFVPVLGSLLDEIGLTPAELVYVQLAGDSGFAWVLPHQCDIDEAILRVETAWGLEARRDVSAVVLRDPNGTALRRRPGQDDLRVVSPAPDKGDAPPPFPYDLLLLEGGRAAMVPAGHGEAVLRALSGRGDAGGLGTSPPAWDDVLDAIEAAPLRGVVRGRALMGTGSGRSEPSTLRVTADALTLQPMDGSD